MARNKNIDQIVYNDTIIQQPLEEVLHSSMMPYAEHVILERALPRVEDGLKPVQRRILYTMHELGLEPDKPHKKSARVVGECLGKYHPHGETSVYDAMVRMAQSFNMRNILVDGHGNFGSIDGDSAAAMRYTEVRMAPLALELLRDIEKDTVKWSLNFDDSLKEPDMLPGRFPNLLVNGASGIAVGLATNIPTHNLAEVIDAVVAQIDNPRITLPSLMQHIKGPDFPTGGYIINGDELPGIYETGRGRVLVRAKVSIENANNGKKLLVITELPYQVNKAALLEKILNLAEEKKGILTGIADIRDESDRTGMRAVIEIRKDADAEKILQYLYKYSDLQTTFGANIVAIADGKPQQLGLLEINRYYIEYQKQVERRRIRYDLDQARAREHILLGLVIAVRNIDKVIKIIRSSKNITEAKARLREAFDLSEKQAQAIVDLRLGRLTALEIETLEQELKEVQALIAELEAILGSERKLAELIKTNLLALKRRYKDERRTKIIKEDIQLSSITKEDFKVVEDVVIGIDNSGNIKRTLIKNFNRSNKEIDDSRPEELTRFALQAKTDETLMLISDLGNCFTLDVENLPEAKWRDKGATLVRQCGFAPGEKAVFALNYKGFPAGVLNFYTAKGLIKRTDLAEYNVRKDKIQACQLREDDRLVAVELDTQGTTVLYITHNGMSLNINKDDVTLTGRVTKGVKAIDIEDNDYVVFAGQITQEGEIITITDRGYAKRSLTADYDLSERNRKGLKTFEFKKNGTNGGFITAAAWVREPYDIIAVQKSGNVTVINTESIFIENRFSPGKPYILTVLDDTVEYALKKAD